MEHLTNETLARLVDERPTAEEARHLAACAACAAELEAFRAQTGALASLPGILPPPGDWPVLEARLRSEGLIRGGLLQRFGLGHTPAWMRVAAALILFLSGVGAGAALTARTGADSGVAALPEADARRFASLRSVDEAAAAVRAAEERYVAALARYEELLAQESGTPPAYDPVTRYAALEHLAAASKAAVQKAPGDPFLNGLLVSVLGEREAAARQVSRRGNWY